MNIVEMLKLLRKKDPRLANEIGRLVHEALESDDPELIQFVKDGIPECFGDNKSEEVAEIIQGILNGLPPGTPGFSSPRLSAPLDQVTGQFLDHVRRRRVTEDGVVMKLGSRAFELFGDACRLIGECDAYLRIIDDVKCRDGIAEIKKYMKRRREEYWQLLDRAN